MKSARPPAALDRIERGLHAGHANGVDVSAEHQRSASLDAVEYADDVRTPGRHVLKMHVQPHVAHVRGNRVRHLCFARGPWHQRRVDRIDRDEIAQEGDDWIGHV